MPGYEPAVHYDRVTAAWQLLLGDDLHYGVFDVGDEPLAEATHRLTSMMATAAGFDLPGGPSPARVLDVGCGSGGPATTIAQRFGGEVVGITTSPVGVAAARDRVAAAGLERVTFEQRDGTDNGFADRSFDVAWVLESAHLMRDRASLYAECARVLRPGGRMVLCDVMRWRDVPFSEVRERRADFAVLREAFADAHFMPLDECAALAESVGLVVDDTVDLTRATIPTFDRWLSNAEVHRAETVDLIGAQGVADFEAGCVLLRDFWLDGTFGYGLLTASRPA